MVRSMDGRILEHLFKVQAVTVTKPMNLAKQYLLLVLMYPGLILAGENMLTEKYTQENLNGLSTVENITFSAPGNLRVVQGASLGVVVRAEPKTMERLRLSIDNKTLFVALQKPMFSVSGGDLSVEVELPHISTLSVTGPGKIVTEALESKSLEVVLDGPGSLSGGKWVSESLSVQISGSGDFRVADITAPSVHMLRSGSAKVNIGEISTTNASVKSKGAGDITIRSVQGESLSVELDGSGNTVVSSTGSVKTQKVLVNGSANYRAERLQSQECSVSVHGSGDVEVAVEQRLNVNVNGSGNVKYHGSPHDIERSVQGSGKIQQAL